MENASKALLIAAAVLIVILLIAFGMKIFNSTSGTSSSVDTTMSAIEVATFNKKFELYTGINKDKSDVIRFLNFVSDNNTNTDKTVYITASGFRGITARQNLSTPSQLQQFMTYLEEGKNYTISVQEYNENGCIKKIKITK